MMRRHVTFDLGTTRLKVACFDETGRVLGQVSRRHVERRDGDRQWQSADAWWQDCIDGYHELCKTSGMSTAAATGFSLSGRAGAAIGVNTDHSVTVDPWQDSRHSAALAPLLDQGVPLYAATLAAKYAWLKTHEPEVADDVSRLLYAKDFLLFRLTGEAITDPSSGPDGVNWPAGIETVVPAELLPRVRLPWKLAGQVSEIAARQLGCKPGLPVATGAHDGICANIGAGATSDASYALTLGTHAVVRTPHRDEMPGVNRFYCFPPDRHAYGANALFAGRALDWVLDQLTEASGESARAAAFAKFGAGLAGQDIRLTPHFFPYLKGQIAPERHTHRRAAFAGLSLGHASLDLFHGAVLGVTFAVAENIAALSRAIPPNGNLRATGGGTLLAAWVGYLATLTERPISVTDASVEGRGAAMCLAVACGDHPDIETAAKHMIPEARVVEPVSPEHGVLAEKFAEWRAARDAHYAGP